MAERQPVGVLRWSPTIWRRVEHIRDRVMRGLGTDEALIPEDIAGLAAAVGASPKAMHWRKPLAITEINRMAPTPEVRDRQGRPLTTPSQRNNSAFVGAGLRYTSREDEFAAFESLPKPIRAALNVTATKISSVSALDVLRYQVRRMGYAAAVRFVVSKLREIEGDEIAVCAGRYEAACRHPLPHTAAKASIQRYGQVEPMRGRRAIQARHLEKLTPNLQFEGLRGISSGLKSPRRRTPNAEPSASDRPNGWYAGFNRSYVRIVHPVDDLRPHNLDEPCWCRPEMIDGIMVHNSMDGREKYEVGGRFS